MIPSIERIRSIWERLGIRNESGATEKDINAFEANYGIYLSPVVRNYFCELNGTKNGKLGMDDEYLIGFWHLDELRTLKEECPDLTANEEPLFVFADHSIWVHAYAVRLATDDSETAVFLIGGDRPLLIAPTFEKFLESYADGDHNMLFGPGVASNWKSRRRSLVTTLFDHCRDFLSKVTKIGL